MQPIIFFYMCITALFASLIMVPHLMKWAHEKGAVDTPDEERKIHNKAIPRIGGVAIFIAFIFSVLLYADFSKEVRGILAGATIIFLVGLIDDLHDLSPRQKLAGQVAAALVAIIAGRFYIDHLGDLLGYGNITFSIWVGIPFTVLAIVGVTNAVNLADGLDGLAGGITTIALMAFFAFAYLDGNTSVMALSACLLGAITGFLKYNIYPAKIFMGDAGSLTLGFLLATLAIILTQGEGRGVSPVSPLLVLALPITDTLWVMIRRIYWKKNPFSADRSHFHHKFLDLGVQHRFTVIIIYGISLLSAVVALFTSHVHDGLILIIYLSGFVTIFLILRYFVRNRDQYRFFKLDATSDLRSSVTFMQIAQRLNGVSRLISFLIAFYLILAAWIVISHTTVSWQVPFAILLSTASLIFLTRRTEGEFHQITFFASSLYISYCVEITGKTHLFPSFVPGNQDDFINSVFVLLIILSLLRIAVSDKGGLLLNSMDLLLLGATIIVMPIFPFTNKGAWSQGTIVKGALLFIALKVISVHSPRQMRILEYLMYLILVFFTVFGLLMS